MKYRPIIVDETLQELTQHGTDDFPLSIDKMFVSDSQCGLVEHWHYEMQFCLVVQDSVTFRTIQGETEVHEGEGFFVNSGVRHACIPVGGKDGVYISVNVRPDLIYGSSNSRLRSNYVEPVLRNRELCSFPLADAPWEKEACGLLGKLTEVYDQQEYGYEFLVRNLICEVWRLIVVHHRKLIESLAVCSFSDQQRINTLQRYIRQNYGERLTLADIAEAGHISKGECCRVFNRVLGTTPVAYLSRFRIGQSVKLLTCSDISISEIARQVGFESSGYFTSCFKKELDCTPKEYRKQKRNDRREASEEEEREN